MPSKQLKVQDFRIRIDKDGTWYYNDLPIVNRNIVIFFLQHLEPLPDGGYLLRIGDETCPVIVDDTPYIVVDVWKETSGDREAFYIRLNDETCEHLSLETLKIREDNVPICKVKGARFPARFSRPAYYRLADYVIQHEDGRFSIPLNDNHYFL